jgi:hypothetical protein
MPNTSNSQRKQNPARNLKTDAPTNIERPQHKPYANALPSTLGTDQKILGAIAQLSTQRHKLELKVERALPSTTLPEKTINTNTAMGIMGYKDKNSFLTAARKNGVFFIRLNARKFCWSESAINAWKREKGVGTPPQPIFT